MKKVLVVDDEFAVRYLVEYQLKKEGYEVILERDGESGIAAAQHHRPDLVILDVNMPYMDGYEVCEQIRQDPRTANIPVIFLTARATHTSKLRAYQLGADEYLNKPLKANELKERVEAIFNRQQDERTNHTLGKNAAQRPGKIITFNSHKGGVGTTTLAIQYSMKLSAQSDLPVLLIDLDLPLGDVATILNLPANRNISNLLANTADQLTFPMIQQHMQTFGENLHILPASASWQNMKEMPLTSKLGHVLTILRENSYVAVLDLGSQLTTLARKAMSMADLLFVVTTIEPVALHHHEAFLKAAADLGLQDKRLLPVLNELHGPLNGTRLAHFPVAHVPYTQRSSDNLLWGIESALDKLIAVTKG